MPPKADRLSAILKRLRHIEARLERLEGGEVRTRRRAGPGDGRTRARPGPQPHCPGCGLSIVPGPERCPRCGMVFSALPARLRPGGRDNPAPGGRGSRAVRPRR